MARNFYKDRFATKGRGQDRDLFDSGSFEAPAVEAFNLRKDANEAAREATDQYEADVAAYKDTQATEAEQGIASLPQFSADERDMGDSGSYGDTGLGTPLLLGSPASTNMSTIDAYNQYLSEEPDLSRGTDGQIAQFGDTEAYSGEVINPDPIYQVPVEEDFPIAPFPIEDGRSINIYTGRPVRDPYVPYEEPSEEMAEYTRPMSAENFGSSPGMGPRISPPREPIFANMGGNLDQGLSRLPLNQQNDTLTQIFQAGFRPRR
tara:strand:- start:124 stop:909 length:786 start_codon:yes stop_codon:yes gene_type:complete